MMKETDESAHKLVTDIVSAYRDGMALEDIAKQFNMHWGAVARVIGYSMEAATCRDAARKAAALGANFSDPPRGRGLRVMTARPSNWSINGTR